MHLIGTNICDLTQIWWKPVCFRCWVKVFWTVPLLGGAALQQACLDWNLSTSISSCLFGYLSFAHPFFKSHLILSYLFFCSSIFLLCYSLLFSSPILCLHALLSPPSSLCLCSNLAVSHRVMVVPKSHFQGRNTLAEGCSAITCRITGLSLTISWETGDSASDSGHSHPDNWRPARHSHKGPRNTGLFHKRASG